jgi:hypothetical protein
VGWWKGDDVTSSTNTAIADNPCCEKKMWSWKM